MCKNKICKKCNLKKCDGCGKLTEDKNLFKVYDENHNLQKGILECKKCKVR